jgi:hypothetical protein
MCLWCPCYNGLSPISSAPPLLIKKLGLNELFETYISIERGVNAVYSVADALVNTLLSVMAGGSHLSHVGLLRKDGLLRRMLNGAVFRSTVR